MNETAGSRLAFILFHPLGGLRRHVRIRVRAGIALHASITLWVSFYYFLTDPVIFGESSQLREFLYVLVGLTLLISIDGLRGNAGFPVVSSIRAMGDQSVRGAPNSFFLKHFTSDHRVRWTRAKNAVKLVIGLVSTMVFWTGLYNYIDLYTFPERWYRDVVLIVVGVGGLVATGTYYDMAFLYPKHYIRGSWHSIEPNAPLSAQIKSNVMAFTSIFFQNFIWIGGFNLVEDYWNTYNPIWDMFCYCVGFGLIIWTDSLIPVSWIDDDEPEDTPSVNEPITPITAQPRKLLDNFDFRVGLSLVGQVVHNNALWNLLDEFVAPNGTTGKYLVYMFVGIVVVTLAGVLQANANVELLSPEAAAMQMDQFSVREFESEIPIDLIKSPLTEELTPRPDTKLNSTQ